MLTGRKSIIRNAKKKWTSTFAVFLGSVICALLFLAGLQQRTQTLKSFSKSTGRITDKGIDFVQPPKGVTRQEVFFLQLHKPATAMFYFEHKQDYTQLLQNLWIGDTVTVYYTPALHNGERFKSELIQIEKRGIVVLSHRSYQEDGTEITIIGGLGFGAMLLFLWNIWRPRQK